nr:unnamed protein product [Callosobruchus chinensis]
MLLSQRGNFNPINQHRSALNTLFDSTDHKIVTRFMNGVFRLKTWGSNPVLEYFNLIGPLHCFINRQINLKTYSLAGTNNKPKSSNIN